MGLLTKSVTSSASPGTRKMPSDRRPLSWSTASARNGTILGIFTPSPACAGSVMIKSSDSPNTDGLKGASLARSISAAVSTFPLAPRAQIRFNRVDTYSLKIFTSLAVTVLLRFTKSNRYDSRFLEGGKVTLIAHRISHPLRMLCL